VEQSDLAALQRRTLRVLVGAQVLGGAGFFLGFAVSVLLAKELTESESLFGLPVAIAVAASALAAAPLGAWMARVGRRPGLAAGYVSAAAGAIGVLLAARAALGRRAEVQGQADLAMGMAGAFGGLAAGPVLHAGGFGLLAIAGATVGAGLFVIALRARPFAPAPAGAA
jgi:MFS family permease